jgi:multiple sugar transport system substrate-binding protein
MRRGSTTGPLVVLAGLALTATSCLGARDDSDPERGAGATEVSLTISANAIEGGKNAAEADWITKYVIPVFVDNMKQKGVRANVKFQPSGVDDEQYKTKLALDLRTGSGADIISLDGIWVGEFAEAGYIKPLDELVGEAAAEWDGWDQIQPTVQQSMSFQDKRYGVPSGTDGRVLYYNEDLFTRAGLPSTWQPESWDDVISAGNRLKAAGVKIPIQLNAGTAMGEATTMQGVLPMLVGTGAEIFDPESEKWQGATANVKQVLGLYDQIYGGSGLGDPRLQQEAKGRDKSFAEFAAGQVGILLEGDYFWRSVIEPTVGIAPMKDRDQTVGYAKIPAVRPGAGIHGQDFVSMSGGGGRTVNPNTDFPQQAWELLAFMNSAEATKALLQGAARITQRDDVNEEVLARDPMLDFVATQVLPLTAFRPGLAVYPQVSVALQQATADIIAGKSPDQAAASYQAALEKALGGSDDIATS